jgi:hypothetical protein
MGSIPASMLIHTVARIRPTTSTDAHNNTTYNYTVPPATSTNLTGRMEQNKASEPLADGRQSSERNWTLFTNESDVAVSDRIVFGSLTFEVEGPPAPMYDGVGFHHLEVALRIFDG